MKFKTKRSEVLNLPCGKGVMLWACLEEVFNAIVTSLFSLVSFPIFLNLFIIIIIMIIVIIFFYFFSFFHGVASQFRAMIFFTFLTFGIIFYSYIFGEQIGAK